MVKAIRAWKTNGMIAGYRSSDPSVFAAVTESSYNNQSSRRCSTDKIIMKILILSINYWPEVTGIGAFTTYRAEYLSPAIK